MGKITILLLLITIHSNFYRRKEGRKEGKEGGEKRGNERKGEMNE